MPYADRLLAGAVPGPRSMPEGRARRLDVDVVRDVGGVSPNPIAAPPSIPPVLLRAGLVAEPGTERLEAPDVQAGADHPESAPRLREVPIQSVARAIDPVVESQSMAPMEGATPHAWVVVEDVQDAPPSPTPDEAGPREPREASVVLPPRDRLHSDRPSAVVAEDAVPFRLLTTAASETGVPADDALASRPRRVPADLPSVPRRVSILEERPAGSARPLEPETVSVTIGTIEVVVDRPSEPLPPIQAPVVPLAPSRPADDPIMQLRRQYVTWPEGR
jgi:hypothetical protein